MSAKRTRSAWFFAEEEGRLAYDDECAFCTRTARRLERFLARRGIALVAINDVRDELGLRPDEPPSGMVLLRGGRRFVRSEAVAELARLSWWTLPVWVASRVPLVASAMGAGYNWIARNRYCFAGKCRLPLPAGERRSHAGAHR